MKLTILKEKLKEGINIVERIAQKSLTLPILNNVLLKGEKTFISLITTNLEIGLHWWSLAKIEKEGEIIVPTRLFSTLIGFLPNGPLELKTDGLF
ncbi:MAG: DNA polymerase III subunit beta, partial [Candidatus Nealsonbacteria bacterium CG_4_10_14_0_2_um_filter_37_10]